MGLSLDRMRTLVRRGVGNQNSTELPDEDVDEYLNMSLWELENNYPFRAKEGLLSTPLITDQYIYSISDSDLGIILDALQSISITDSKGKRTKLRRYTRSWFDENFDIENTGYPTAYLRENDLLYIYPVPGEDEEDLLLEIAILTSVESLVDGSQETTGLPRNWDELVVEGAINRAHFYNEDYNLSRAARNMQISKIKEAVPVVSQEEKDTHLGGLDVAWNSPQSPDGVDSSNPRIPS